MAKRRTGFVFVGLGAALLLAALLLFLYNSREDALAGQASYDALAAIQALMDENAGDGPQMLVPDETRETQETLAPTEPPELEVVQIDGHGYIGYLSVPAYDIELPIMADCTMEKLQLAPCLEYGSPLTDDAVIAAHNFKHHFRFLHDIQVGEDLTFTDMRGDIIRYTVTTVTILHPKDVYEVRESEHDLVLYTCTNGGNSRVVVGCDRV